MEEGITNVKLPCYMPRRMPSSAVQLKSEVWGTDFFHARNRAPTAEPTRCCARHFTSSICSAPDCRANALRCAEGAARRRTMVLQAKNTNIEHGAISFSLTPGLGAVHPGAGRCHARRELGAHVWRDQGGRANRKRSQSDRTLTSFPIRMAVRPALRPVDHASDVALPACARVRPCDPRPVLLRFRRCPTPRSSTLLLRPNASAA
jgi:hypothetical protein